MSSRADESAVFDFGACAEFEEEVQRLVDGDDVADEVRSHVASCDGCRRFHDALVATRRAVGQALAGAHLPELPPGLVASAHARSRDARRARPRLVFIGAIAGAVGLAAAVLVVVAQLSGPAKPQPVATVAWTMGEVHVSGPGRDVVLLPPSEAKESPLMAGDVVACGRWSGAGLELAGGSSIVVDSGQVTSGRSEWRLESGRVIVSHAEGSPALSVATAEAVVTTRGTEFEVRRLGKRTATLVRAGAVTVKSAARPPAASRVDLRGEGEGAVVEAGHEADVAGGNVVVRRIALEAGASSAEAVRSGAALLRYRLSEGMRWRWHFERKVRFSAEKDDPLGLLARIFLGGGEEEAALAADVAFAVEKLSGDARYEVLVGPEGKGVRIEIDARGRRRLVASEGRGPLSEALHPSRSFHLAGAEVAPRLPAEAVKPGDSWEHKASGTVLKSPGNRIVLRLDLHIKYRLASAATEGAGALAIEQEIVRRDFEIVDIERDRVIARVKSTGSGRAVFDALSGELVRSELKIATRFSPRMARGGRRGQRGPEIGDISYTETITQRLVERAH